MFTEFDRKLLQEIHCSYADKKMIFGKIQKHTYLLIELERENSELKTKVELYESLIQRLLKLNPDTDDISKIELIHSGEIYRVDGYNLESCKNERKILHIDLICTSPVTKNFKEEK